MKKYHLLSLSLLSGLLLSIGWPADGFPGFLFLGFVPFLAIEDHITRNRHNFSRYAVLFYVYPGFLVWNVLTTYWIWNSTPVAVLAWTLNALFMGVVFHVFHISRRLLFGGRQGYFMLPFFWCLFEYFHMNWDLTWPWLNLGNGFASAIRWIQWYEFTGALGGTLWVLTANILAWKFLSLFLVRSASPKPKLLYGGLVVLAIALPVILSGIMYVRYAEKADPIRVVIVQPNLDPYLEQYTLPPPEVVDLNLKVASPLLDPSVDFIIGPESAIQEDIWEGEYEYSRTLALLKNYLAEQPGPGIVIGASTFRRLSEGEEVTSAARYHDREKFWYEAYNTAFFLDSSGDLQLHHKSRLTPGVEKMPSWKILRPLEKLAIDLGGTVGTLGIDRDPACFVARDSLLIGPLICYESGYGEFCSGFVRKGASVFFLITNDGWWGHTPGHRQHLSFSSLRAIETRRSIARSANTGISAIINQRGDILQPTRYWTRDAIKGDLNLNHRLTFYAVWGDYIGRISGFSSGLLVLLSLVFWIRNRKNPAS